MSVDILVFPPVNKYPQITTSTIPPVQFESFQGTFSIDAVKTFSNILGFHYILRLREIFRLHDQEVC